MKLVTVAVLFSVFTCVFGTYGYLAQDNIPIKRNWVDAHGECVNQGLILATPDTNAKNGELKAFLTAHSLAYTVISANDLLKEGEFQWMTTGQPVTNTGMWLSGEPSNSQGNEDCVHVLHVLYKLGWNDDDCEQLSAVVCQTATDEAVALAKSRTPLIRQAYERKYGGLKSSAAEEDHRPITVVF